MNIKRIACLAVFGFGIFNFLILCIYTYLGLFGIYELNRDQIGEMFIVIVFAVAGIGFGSLMIYDKWHEEIK